MRIGETTNRSGFGCAVIASTGGLRRFYDDEAIVEYLKTALEESDPAFFVKAVGNVAGPKSLMLPELPAPARRPNRSHGRATNCPCDYSIDMLHHIIRNMIYHTFARLAASVRLCRPDGARHAPALYINSRLYRNRHSDGGLCKISTAYSLPLWSDIRCSQRATWRPSSSRCV